MRAVVLPLVAACALAAPEVAHAAPTADTWLRTRDGKGWYHDETTVSFPAAFQTAPDDKAPFLLGAQQASADHYLVVFVVAMHDIRDVQELMHNLSEDAKPDQAPITDFDVPGARAAGLTWKGWQFQTTERDQDHGGTMPVLHAYGYLTDGYRFATFSFSVERPTPSLRPELVLRSAVDSVRFDPRAP